LSHLIFFFTRSPTGNTVVSDAFDAVMTAAIFDEKISLVFEESLWSNFVTQKNQTEMIINITSKLQTLTSMTEMNVFIKSQEAFGSTPHKLTATKALTQFFIEVPCKTKIISNNEFQSLLKESDKLLSF